MRAKEFKAFEQVITTAEKNDAIWWAGYLWIELTEKQFASVYKILNARGFEHNEDGCVMLPSGLGIKPAK